MTPVFVYGTLKRGHGNHELLMHGARFVGEATTVEGFKIYQHDRPVYPMAKPAPADCQLRGEVWLVDDRTLAALDRLEGNGHFYEREKTPVEVSEQTNAGRLNARSLCEAWIYIYLGHVDRLHECGGMAVETATRGTRTEYDWR